MDKTTTWLVRGAALVIIVTPVALFSNQCIGGISAKTGYCNQTRIERLGFFLKQGRFRSAFKGYFEPKYEGISVHWDRRGKSLF